MMHARLALLFLCFLAAIQIQTAKYLDSNEYEEWEEFKEFQRWKHSKKHQDPKKYWSQDLGRYNGNEQDTYNDGLEADDPPPIDEAARMARYIVNQNNWTSIATLSSIPKVRSYPFVNVVSYADGPLLNGTGMPYIFITPLDYTAQDLAKDSRATLSMTLAEGEYCAKKLYDPMDPRCARVYLTGKIKAVKNNTAEYDVAKNAVFTRHPWLAHMPADHHFFFAKLKIVQIALLDTFGGPKYISLKDYFTANQIPKAFQKTEPTNSFADGSSESGYLEVTIV
ncbi:protein CREG1 [Neodiprion pinetum]|uniref:protein CREG1 n=1 Tax=Neodiprion pinetum TaxID=441929 RepID=UPI001EDD3284|nr:protein CREG1 [Neodiprion pinetum]